MCAFNTNKYSQKKQNVKKKVVNLCLSTKKYFIGIIPLFLINLCLSTKKNINKKKLDNSKIDKKIYLFN